MAERSRVPSARRTKGWSTRSHHRSWDEGARGASGGAPAIPVETVVTPYNMPCRYPDYLRDFEALVHEVKAQDAGLMLIKAAARNLWKTGGPPADDVVRPLEEQAQLDAAIAFALARDGATGICSPGDVDLLPTVIEAERRTGRCRSSMSRRSSTVCPTSSRRSSTAKGTTCPSGWRRYSGAVDRSSLRAPASSRSVAS